MRKSNVIFTSVCGIAGTIALTIYFTAPFNFMPLPPANATAEQIMTFGKKYHTAILVDTVLQQLGTILTVIFVLSLLQMAGTYRTLAGKLTLLTACVITSLSLAEGTFALGAAQAGNNGHAEAALTCFELTNVFIHIFLLAPSLFLMLGVALVGTRVLPNKFTRTAIMLGMLFQSLGIVSLFDNKLLLLVIIVLMLQNVWTIAACVTLLIKKDAHKFHTS